MTDQPLDLVTPATVAGRDEATDAPVPQLLLWLLERRFLTDFEPSRWRLSATPDDSARPLQREVLGLARPQAGQDWRTALAHALTASHWNGHAVTMTVHGDGTRHRVMLGGRRLSGRARGGTDDFLAGQASVLRAHVPGLVLGETARLDGDSAPELSAFLHGAPALAVVTGIPSPRSGPGAAEFQSLDRLIGAVGRGRYALSVVAEPLSAEDLDGTLDLCRRLKGEVHSLVSGTRTTQESSTDTAPVGDEDAGSTRDKSKYLYAMAVFCAASGVLAPRISRLVQPAMLATNLLPRDRPAPQRSHTEQRGESTSVTLLDAEAEACERLLDRHIERLTAARSNGWWRTSVYVAADGEATLEAVTSALRSIASGDTTALDPLRVIRPDPWTVRSAMIRGQALRLQPASDDLGHPLGGSYDTLGTCMTSDELAVLVNLPRRDVPGLPMRDVGEFALSAPAATDASITVGALQDSLGNDLQPVSLTAEALNRHVFITGMTGYGKTTTAQNLLVEAYRELEVPFLVIEPAKAEYRQLAGHPALRGRLRVHAIGSDAALPLRLNPFVPIEDVPLARHIDLLKAVFNAAFPMFAGMSYVLEEAMLEIYTERGWNLHTSANDVLGPTPSPADLSALTPSIGDLTGKIEQVLESKQYAREVHQNMGAALRSRLQSLMVGTKGMALDTRRTIPAHELFTQPTVIELRNLGDDEEKSFVMAVLLCLLYEYAESRQHATNRVSAERLQHLTLVEEAHRLLRASRSPSGPESPDAQAKAVTMFTDMLAEMRAYGEGFVIADQIPTKLAPETVKNSNVKILHRLVSLDDRAIVAGAVNLTEAQSRHLSTLPPGEAVVHDERIGSAVLVRMRPALGGDQPGDAAGTTPQLPDLSFLHRNGACRRCPAPCTFLHLTDAATGADELDDALAPVFDALLVSGPEQAWDAWERWRSGWRPPALGERPASATVTGVTYCGSSQSAHRWLQRLLTARGAAVGRRTLDARDRLRQDRASREIARLCVTWADATELDDGGRQRFAEVQQSLRALVAEQPPRELPGCADCPARCLALPSVAPHLPDVGQAVAARATSGVSVETRLRGLEKLAEERLPETYAQWSSRGRESDLLYCLVTTATADGGDAAPLLAALRGDDPDA